MANVNPNTTTPPTNDNATATTSHPRIPATPMHPPPPYGAVPVHQNLPHSAGPQAIAFLAELPKFSGNPRPDETKRYGVDVRTFFRSLDNYFLQNNITDDNKKITTVLSLIDKEKGNALGLTNNFAGRVFTYHQMRQDIIKAYPNFSATDFIHAARSVIDLNLKKYDIFTGMSKLECHSRALVESYLSNPANTRLGLTLDTAIEPIPGCPRITIAELMQNLIMHVVTCTQLEEESYDRIANISSAVPSTSLMAEAVNSEERRQSRLKKKPRANERPNEVIWAVHGSDTPAAPERPAYPLYKREGSKRRSQPPPARESQGSPREITCYTCGKRGHFSRDCRERSNTCSRCGDNRHSTRECRASNLECDYCNAKGHNARACRKRAAQAKNKGKHCTRCGKRDSHVAKDCYVNLQDTGRERRVRGLQSSDQREDDAREDPGTYDATYSDPDDYNYDGNNEDQ